MQTEQLTSYINDVLQISDFTDYAPNGLQIEGRSSVKRLATAVTANYRVIEQAIDWKADALLVHHGYFWKGESPCIVGMKQQRIQALLKHNINLYAYHLPLDCHLTLGNNAQLANVCSFLVNQSHTIGCNKDLLWQGELSAVQSSAEFSKFLSDVLRQQVIHLPDSSDKQIKSLAWCSGGAQDLIEKAASLGVDAYISGEVSERTYYQAQELDIHYFSCGHHATERYGVQALGMYLASELELEHQFFDANNPV